MLLHQPGGYHADFMFSIIQTFVKNLLNTYLTRSDSATHIMQCCHNTENRCQTSAKFDVLPCRTWVSTYQTGLGAMSCFVQCCRNMLLKQNDRPVQDLTCYHAGHGWSTYLAASQHSANVAAASYHVCHNGGSEHAWNMQFALPHLQKPHHPCQ